MSVSDLRGAVLSVDGIAAAEVEARSDRGPSVRVWLDGSRASDLVAGELARVIESAGFAAPTAPQAPQRRVSDHAPAPFGRRPSRAVSEGLRRPGPGRGLDALIPAVDREPASPPNRLEMLAVETSRSGTEVRAVDRFGRSAVAPVGEGISLNDAVAATVAELVGLDSPPTVRAVEVRRLADTSVLVAVIHSEGRRAVGSAIVDGGLPLALGSAVWAALNALA